MRSVTPGPYRDHVARGLLPDTNGMPGEGYMPMRKYVSM
jgi:hypothetical protein